MNAPAPLRIASPSGLVAQVNANGSIVRMDHRDVMVNAFLGNEMEGGPTNLYLRQHGTPRAWTPLLGPRSPGGRVRADEDGLEIAGEWHGVRFRLTLVLAAGHPAWFWHLALENASAGERTLDLVYAHDLALADYGIVRVSEYYVSQYVDQTPLRHPDRGNVLAVRQNLPIGGRHPWAIIGSLAHGTSFCTDALQFLGLAAREGLPPVGLVADRLPGVRRQHEHAMAVIQDAPLRLAPGARATRGFFGWFEIDHPDASSDRDLVCVDRALALPEATPGPAARAGSSPAAAARPATLFSDAPLLRALDLEPGELDACFGIERRGIERDGERILSFFTGADAHVVLAAKERASLRAHGQVVRTGAGLTPDEASLTTTVWMNGVFHSMVTQGHVSINRFLSTTHGYLGLFRSHGQRVFVELDGGWQLLDEPSAWEMTPTSARWLYKHAGGLIEVRSWAGIDAHELWLSARVVTGAPCRFLVSNHLALHGDNGAQAARIRWQRDAQGVAFSVPADTELGRRFPDGTFRIDFTPETPIALIGADELLFLDGRSRHQSFAVLVSAPSTTIGLRITGQLVQAAPKEAPAPAAARQATDAARATRFWRDMTGPLAIGPVADARASEALQCLGAVLPWFAHDALIHYLAPRGLEQFTGGGWGARDVAQGPVELLLSLGHYAPVRDLLQRLFSNQNPDGDWPQWFTFFARERNLRGPDSHGDIVFWPLLALAEYLSASEDFALLDEKLPFFHPEGDGRAEQSTMLGHVERALALIAQRAIPGTSLTAYGHGDWNDTLQPVDRAVAERLCSAWTVTLHHQMFASLAAALHTAGRHELAASLDAACVRIRDDFQRLLVVDGVVAGLAQFHPDGRVEPWLHPNDGESGIRYSILPMIHAILADLFTPDQAVRHVGIIREQLLGADGARLFDQPFPYHGGLERRFRRAESSPFFGREVGLMYMHAHLRYAEAMAHLGRADALFLALQQANPVGLQAVVPNARPRQANCYTSSSDADFPDRIVASAHYAAVRTGDVPLEGGWRVYSSGPGIAVHLVRERLLGLRLGASVLGIDPVLPAQLDGLEIDAVLAGQPIRIRYRVGPRGYGPVALALNGTPLPFERVPNPYREGGVAVAMGLLRARLAASGNELIVGIG